MNVRASKDYPSAAQCAPIAALALEVLADLRHWADEYPSLETVPLEAMAMATAAISPWQDAKGLRLGARFSVWTYALDDYVEQAIEDVDHLDDLLGRCQAIVRTGEPDESQPLLAALSAWQTEMNQQPLYPLLADLWIEKFARAMAGNRYDWVAGRAREHNRGPSDVQEYLRHADSVMVWITHFPRLVAADHHGVVEQRDVLTAALDDVQVAIRLANDLATISWERTQSGQNNILMHDTTPDWVRAELARRAESARQRLIPLAGGGFRPAEEIVRNLDWAIGFYALADFRGWGSDALITTTPRPAGA